MVDAVSGYPDLARDEIVAIIGLDWTTINRMVLEQQQKLKRQSADEMQQVGKRQRTLGQAKGDGRHLHPTSFKARHTATEEQTKQILRQDLAMDSDRGSPAVKLPIDVLLEVNAGTSKSNNTVQVTHEEIDYEVRATALSREATKSGSEGAAAQSRRLPKRNRIASNLEQRDSQATSRTAGNVSSSTSFSGSSFDPTTDKSHPST